MNLQSSQALTIEMPKEDTVIIKARSVMRILLSLGIMVAAVISIGLASLIYPFAPRQSSSVRFDGFIVLPSRRLPSVLDYMTFNGLDLFGAGTSIGNLFKVTIDAGELGTGKVVAELTDVAGVHGVA